MLNFVKIQSSTLRKRERERERERENKKAKQPSRTIKKKFLARLKQIDKYISFALKGITQSPC